MLFQVIMIERSEQIGIDDGPFVEGKVRTLIIVAQDRAQHILRDMIAVQKQRLDIRAASCRALDRQVKVGLSDNPTADERIENVLLDAAAGGIDGPSGFLPAVSIGKAPLVSLAERDRPCIDHSRQYLTCQVPGAR